MLLNDAIESKSELEQLFDLLTVCESIAPSESHMAMRDLRSAMEAGIDKGHFGIKILQDVEFEVQKRVSDRNSSSEAQGGRSGPSATK